MNVEQRDPDKPDMNEFKMKLQSAIRQRLQITAQFIHLKAIVCLVHINKTNVIEEMEMKSEDLEEFDWDIDQRNFNEHYNECISKLQASKKQSLFSKKKTKGALVIQEALALSEEGQQGNEISFINRMYEKVKEINEKKARDYLLKGKKKKRSKTSIKMR